MEYKHEADWSSGEEAFKNQGIRFESIENSCRDCKTTTLFCKPEVRKSAIAKVALALLDAGVKITRITPANVIVGRANVPDIELNDTGDWDAPSLTRDQIFAISDCKREYSASLGPVKRVITVRSRCDDRMAEFYYVYYDADSQKLSKVLGAQIDSGESVVLLDDLTENILITNKDIYYYVDAFKAEGEGAALDDKTRWSTPQDSTGSIRMKADGRVRLFRRAQLVEDGGGLELDLDCRRQR